VAAGHIIAIPAWPGRVVTIARPATAGVWRVIPARAAGAVIAIAVRAAGAPRAGTAPWAAAEAGPATGTVTAPRIRSPAGPTGTAAAPRAGRIRPVSPARAAPGTFAAVRARAGIPVPGPVRTAEAASRTPGLRAAATRTVPWRRALAVIPPAGAARGCSRVASRTTGPAVVVAVPGPARIAGVRRMRTGPARAAPRRPARVSRAVLATTAISGTAARPAGATRGRPGPSGRSAPGSPVAATRGTLAVVVARPTAGTASTAAIRPRGT
jgi:hypothetical protein